MRCQTARMRLHLGPGVRGTLVTCRSGGTQSSVGSCGSFGSVDSAASSTSVVAKSRITAREFLGSEVAAERSSRSFARLSHVSRSRKFPPPFASYLQMSKKYEIRSGRRRVSMQYSSSALQAAVDYVRTFGCRNDEITILGVDTVAWRGARFSAVLVPAEPPPVE